MARVPWNACFLSAAALSGCSLGGFALGSALSTPGTPPRSYVQAIQAPKDFETLFSVHPGDELTLLLRSGRKLTGNYLGLVGPTEPGASSAVRLALKNSDPEEIVQVSTSHLQEVRYPQPFPRTTLALVGVGLLVDLLVIWQPFNKGQAEIGQPIPAQQ